MSVGANRRQEKAGGGPSYKDRGDSPVWMAPELGASRLYAGNHTKALRNG